MTGLDLKGWFAVEDDGEEANVQEVVGTVTVSDKTFLAMRDAYATWLAQYAQSYAYFPPGERARAEAHAAKLRAEATAAAETEDADDDEEEAA